jgi:hypothetical protein
LRRVEDRRAGDLRRRSTAGACCPRPDRRDRLSVEKIESCISTIPDRRTRV